MRGSFALAVFCVGLAVGSRAHADAGVNLSWDACTGESGVQNKTFACNTNSASRTLYGSFVLADDQPSFIAAEIIIDFQAQSDNLPAWWEFYSVGACRKTAMSVSFAFDSDPNEDCHDPWSGQATGGVGAYSVPGWPGGDPNTARLTMVAAVPSTTPMELTAGTEYYCFKVTINSTKTLGTGACSGCTVPVCIVLSQINAIQLGNVQEELTAPALNNIVSWQTGEECSGAHVPQNLTWGQIRSVLR